MFYRSGRKYPSLSGIVRYSIFIIVYYPTIYSYTSGIVYTHICTVFPCKARHTFLNFKSISSKELKPRHPVRALLLLVLCDQDCTTYIPHYIITLKALLVRNLRSLLASPPPPPVRLHTLPRCAYMYCTIHTLYNLSLMHVQYFSSRCIDPIMPSTYIVSKPTRHHLPPNHTFAQQFSAI